MLKSAIDEGSEELVHCIEKFQQASLEPSEEPPQVLLWPGQLPWDKNTEQEDSTSKIFTSIQNVGRMVYLSLGNESRHSQGQTRNEHHSDHQAATTLGYHNLETPISFLKSDSPPQSIADDSHSSSNSSDPTTTAVLSKESTGIPLESSGVKRGAIYHEDKKEEERDEQNKFDDDTSNDGSESIQVLHVDDPKLAFGQSVYIGRHNYGEEFTYTQSQLSLEMGVPSIGGENSVSVSKPSYSVAGRIHTVTAPSSSYGEMQISPSDLLSKTSKVVPLTDPLTGSTPVSTVAGAHLVPPPVSVSSLTPTSLCDTQHPQQRLPQMPSVAQSLSSSIHFTGSHNPVPSLGLSTSMPPLRARAVDEERANELGSTLSEVRMYVILQNCIIMLSLMQLLSYL